jgi:hypothetical protein
MSTEQERAAFEALAKEQGWELDKYPGSVGAYVEPDTAAAWLSYRAALAAAPVQAVPEFSDAAWALAQKVRADLDRQSCPGVYMDIAMESIARNLAAAPQVPAVPDGYKLTAVKGFDELMTALNRAESKGYLPDAVAEHWSAFDWRASPSAAQQPAERVPLTDEQLLALLGDIDADTKRLPPGIKAFARAVESAHGISAAGVKEPGNA